MNKGAFNAKGILYNKFGKTHEYECFMNFYIWKTTASLFYVILLNSMIARLCKQKAQGCHLNNELADVGFKSCLYGLSIAVEIF